MDFVKPPYARLRSLVEIIEPAVVLSRGPTIEIDESIPGMHISAQAPVSDTLRDVERAHILRVLEQTRWVVHGDQGAAAVLGINPSTLRSRMWKLGIKRPA